MQIVIDIDVDVLTRLFDNGAEDYAIANDDLFAIAKAIRKGTSLPKGHERLIKTDVLDKIKAEITDLDDADYDYEGYYKAITDVLQVIDKYRE